ncbi:unnamed protein product [Linum trigynum]|uniref:TIR domain-containing protein n=1 Tax=Linum trigynum TaxID=586398 RepID=A0AAV2GWD6_9ROSI
MLSLLATSSFPWKRPIDPSFHRINSPERFPGLKRPINLSFYQINSPERFPGRFSRPIRMGQIPSLSSTSKNSLPAADYEVFINFRGSDIRYNFADSLYKFLDHYGIRTFFDTDQLPKGEKFDDKLIKSIEESKIYIPIFSPNYATTILPLMELAHMVKCCKKGKGHIMLPIFYMVSTEDVKNQTGEFGESFRRIAGEKDAETRAEWEEALQTVSDLQGWTVNKSTRQGVLFEKVFSKVRSLLMENYKLVTSKLVEIEPHVEQVKGLLSKGVKIVGIHGMSGIGKTNIAKAVYDNVSGKFDRCCFVEDVREILSGKDGVVTLQNKILSDILRHDTKVRDASQGIQVTKDRICCLSSVLIVLDNVAQGFEFEQILGDLKDFSSNSRFIITMTDLRVIDPFSRECEPYSVEEMHDDIALKLFSRHAFGFDDPPPEYMSLSNHFVKVAAGLPLALTAIGSLLHRKDKSFWVAKLNQLRDIPADKVEEKLEIVLMDATPDEQQIFLDIACFFNGEHYDRPFYLWSDSNLHPLVAVESLCLRSLIKINERKEFWMHEQYKILGRSIIRKENVRNPWKRSRIWSNEDVVDMLRHKEGTDELEILKVDMEDNEFELTDAEFKKLSGLKYLEVRNGRLGGHFKDMFPQLRWLRLDNCSSIPIGLSLKELVIFDLCSCPITDDWEGWNEIQVAPNLKVVDVSSCLKLSAVPDLSRCRSLEHLILQDCHQMRGELHVGNFENLKVLKLRFSKINKLRGDIGRLQNLQEIDAGFSDLAEVPAGIGKLSSLTKLGLRRIRSKEVPVLPRGLKVLHVSSPRVPNLSELADLEELSFSYCDGPEIPADAVWKLSKLKTLRLLHCSCDRLPHALPSSLNTLRINDCRSLEVLPDLSNLSLLTELVLSEVGVQEVVGLGELSMLKTLNISNAPNLVHLNGLEQLVLLKTLRLLSCDVLGTQPAGALIPEIPGLYRIGELSLVDLTVSDCPIITSVLLSLSKFAKLKQLALEDFGTHDIDYGFLSPDQLVLDVSTLQDMERLCIVGCKHVTEVQGLERLEQLRDIRLWNFTSIKKLPGLSGLKNLMSLEIRGCAELSEVTGLENLELLDRLVMDRCTSMKELPRLFKNVRFLEVSYCGQLAELTGLEKVEGLVSLKLLHCASIAKLPDRSCFGKLVLWRVSPELVEAPGNEGWLDLE